MLLKTAVFQDPHHPQCPHRGLLPEDSPAGQVLPADVHCVWQERAQRGQLSLALGERDLVYSLF